MTSLTLGSTTSLLLKGGLLVTSFVVIGGGPMRVNVGLLIVVFRTGIKVNRGANR